MATRDWASLGWDPNLSFALPTERQLAQSSMADAGKGAESRLATTAQNLDLLRSLGYTGSGFTNVGEDYGFGAQPVWSDEARTWLANNGYNVGVAHDPGTSPGGRPEYWGLTGPDGKFVQGQSDPTMTISDTMMDNITPFLMLAGPFASAISTSAGMAGAAGGGLGSLGSVGDGVTALGSSWSPEALGLTGGITPGVSAAELAGLSSGIPGAVDVAGGLSSAASTGASLVPQAGKSLWDMVQAGALKGAGIGGLKGLVTGQNPLQSALKGAVGGAIGGGISSIGSGAFGDAVSGLDAGGPGDLIPGAFDAVNPTTNGILNNLGSFGDAINTAGGPVSWDAFNWGMDPSGGWTSGLGDLGSFSDPITSGWGTGGGLDLSGVDLGSFGTNPGSFLDGLDLSGASGGTDWLKTLVNGGKSLASTVGGDKNLAALIGAGWGALSSGGTQTKASEPWVAAQPFLKNALGGLDEALTNLRQHPYTPQQTQQYQQAFSGLDQARATLPGLLNWSQNAMQRQSTTPSYASLFGGGQPAQQMPQQPQGPTMQAGGPGGLLNLSPNVQNLMVKGRGLIG